MLPCSPPSGNSCSNERIRCGNAGQGDPRSSSQAPGHFPRFFQSERKPRRAKLFWCADLLCWLRCFTKGRSNCILKCFENFPVCGVGHDRPASRGQLRCRGHFILTALEVLLQAQNRRKAAYDSSFPSLLVCGPLGSWEYVSLSYGSRKHEGKGYISSDE